MKLKEFLKDHFDDYVYIKRSDGSAVLDMMVKFVPFWVSSSCRFGCLSCMVIVRLM